MLDTTRAEEHPLLGAFDLLDTDTISVKRAMETLLEAGAYVLFVDPHGTGSRAKAPWDLRSGPEKSHDARGPHGGKGGVYLATNNPDRARRHYERAVAALDGDEPNIGVSIGPSGLILVDADTADDVAAVQRLATAGTGTDPADYVPTTWTPGVQDADGQWVHKNGGHWWFVDDMGLAAEVGRDHVKVPDSKAEVYLSGRYGMVTPSRRAEGRYVTRGPARLLSEEPWLVELLRAASQAERPERAAPAVAPTPGSTVASIIEWNDEHTWDELLTDVGWERSGTDRCGCPVWHIPGHASQRSGIAHEAGCSEESVTLEGGSAPLHLFTDDVPRELVAVARNGAAQSRWTKADVRCAFRYGGDWAEFYAGEGFPPGYEALPPEAFELPDGPAHADPTAIELEDTVFEYSEITRHIRDQARASLMSPWSTLFVEIGKVLLLTPYWVHLPSIIGRNSPASLNTIVALVGPSGAGKSVASGSSGILDLQVAGTERADMFCDGETPDRVLSPENIASGEAISTLYVERRKFTNEETKGTFYRLVQCRRAVWIKWEEVDRMVALMNRTSSTLTSEERVKWDGGKLGARAKTAELNIQVEPRTYRGLTTINVQPERAAEILDQADGGFTQRLLWAEALDPHAGDDDLPEAEPRTVQLPNWSTTRNINPLTGPLGPLPVYVEVDDEVRAFIRACYRKVQRGEDGALTGLDAHRNLNRLKVAAGLAAMHGSTRVTVEVWELAGAVMEHSDRCRAGVIRRLSELNAEKHRARGAGDAIRDEGRRALNEEKIADAAEKMLNWLRKQDEPLPSHVIRKAANSKSRRRIYHDEALALLVKDGRVVEVTDDAGVTRYAARDAE